jgi:hypothetical protein
MREIKDKKFGELKLGRMNTGNVCQSGNILFYAKGCKIFQQWRETVNGETKQYIEKLAMDAVADNDDKVAEASAGSVVVQTQYEDESAGGVCNYMNCGTVPFE